MPAVPEQQGAVELSPSTRSGILREKVWKWNLMGCAGFGGQRRSQILCHMAALPSYEIVLPPATRLADYQHALTVTQSAEPGLLHPSSWAINSNTPSEHRRHRPHAPALACSSTSRPDPMRPHSANARRKRRPSCSQHREGQTCRPARLHVRRRETSHGADCSLCVACRRLIYRSQLLGVSCKVVGCTWP